MIAIIGRYVAKWKWEKGLKLPEKGEGCLCNGNSYPKNCICVCVCVTDSLKAWQQLFVGYINNKGNTLGEILVTCMKCEMI